MRHLFILFFLSLALFPAGGEARTIADLFATEPGQVFPLLTRTKRLDMVDYYNSGQVVSVQNNLEGDSRLLELDSAYLKVQTSDSRVVEMLMSLEDEYGITIEDDKVAEMKTVADVVRCVEGLIEG